MNILKVKTSGEVYILPIKDNAVSRVLDEECQYTYERVKPRGLGHKYCMVVDEEGQMKDIPINFIGSKLYSKELVHPIAGDIFIFKENNTVESCSWEGLNDYEVNEVLNLIRESLEKE